MVEPSASIIGITTPQVTALTALFPSGILPVGPQNVPPNPVLGDTRWSPGIGDQIAIGWVLANGRFTAGFAGASAQQLTNLAALYGSQIPFIPIFTPGSATGGNQGTPSLLGDVKQSYVSGDDLNDGWVILDGRTITAIAGISGPQIANATSLYGGAALPTVAATGSLSALHARVHRIHLYSHPTISAGMDRVS